MCDILQGQTEALSSKKNTHIALRQPIVFYIRGRTIPSSANPLSYCVDAYALLLSFSYTLQYTDTFKCVSLNKQNAWGSYFEVPVFDSDPTHNSVVVLPLCKCSTMQCSAVQCIAGDLMVVDQMMAQLVWLSDAPGRHPYPNEGVARATTDPVCPFPHYILPLARTQPCTHSEFSALSGCWLTAGVVAVVAVNA